MNTKNIEWIEKVYQLVQENQIDDAIDVVFDNIDRLCWETHGQDRKPIEDILDYVDLTKLDTCLCRSFLTASSWVRKDLKNWNQFYQKVKEKYQKEIPDRWEKVLRGFEPI